MGKMTRRDFLRYSAGAGLTWASSHFLPGCGCGGPPPYIPLDSDTPTTESAKVAAVLGNDLTRMTLEILEAVGGIDSIVHPGETVFIKPNFGGVGLVNHNPFPSGDCTKPEIAIAVAEECLKADAAHVIIGEAGQVPRFAWETVATLDGSTNLAVEAKRLNDSYPGRLTLACLNEDSPAWDPVDSPHTDLGKIKISSLVARADRVISIPVVKTHRWCHVTGAMKNFVGVTNVNHYGIPGMQWRSRLHNAAGGVAQCFLDIVAAVKPDLAIMDGSICCEGNGPHVQPGWWGTTVNVKDRLGQWFLLAGTDLAALDATTARIINHDVAVIDHLQRAYSQGLGQIQQDKIQIDGADLGKLIMDWKPAELIRCQSEILFPGFMLLFGE